ncbi:MAG: MATE family efflux transporter, partial [Bryobacterales bacterium]|nr:MATE family efflux transporter [Bryobacterales bacterium]
MQGAVHPFEVRPHFTVLAQSLPILGSLLAEPLTGLIDTAFVARLGAEALAALGVGSMVLAAAFWAFGFLGVATQTKVASLCGEEARAGSADRSAARLCLAAVAVALLIGGVAAVVGLPLSGPVARAMGADGEVQALTVDYLSWRLLAAPALLASFAAFGALRGAQDMRTPLLVAGGMNALNVLLDPLLIFGMAGLPAMGVAGAALASAISHWAGAAWAVAAAFRKLGWPDAFDARQIRGLLAAGVDLVFRALSLNAFLLLGTRKATLIGVGPAALHQVIRSVWFFNALFLDSFAILGQSLIAYFLGNVERSRGRDVARVV